MKKLTLLAFLVFASISHNANAQATTSAAAKATIVTPIGITKTTGKDLSFGNIAVTTTGGTVTLPATSAAVRTTTGGVTLPSTSGTVSAASFDVAGTASYTYTITIPTAITLTLNGGSATMEVTAITNSVGTTGALSTTGSQNILVGGTLTVSSGQIAGDYSNANALTVVVNYN